MKVSTDDKEYLIEWAQQRTGFQFRDDAKAIASLDGEDRIRAVVVYDCISRCDCNIHIASDGSRRWMTRQFMFELFAYPFIQLGLRRVTGLVPAKNETALRFDLRVGFEFEGRCRNAMPDDDVIVLGMLRENCVYIPGEYRHV